MVHIKYLYKNSIFKIIVGQFLYFFHYILKYAGACKNIYYIIDNKLRLWIRKTCGTSLVLNENSNILVIHIPLPLLIINYVDFNTKFNKEKQRKRLKQPMSNSNYGLLYLEIFVDNYSFLTKQYLKYEVFTPHISYYNTNIAKYFYYSTLSFQINLRNEILNYLVKYLYSIFEVLDKFNSHLFIDHNLAMRDCLTISSLVKNKNLKYYLKFSKFPLINNNILFNFIYSAYFVVNTEVYKLFGRNLIYLEVNYVYPYKYIRPLDSYIVTLCISVYVKKYIIKYTIPLYKYNLSRDISVYSINNKKYIIKFLSLSYPESESKVILYLWNANENRLFYSYGFEYANANSYKKNNINKFYLNIILLIGLVLSLSIPSLICTLTGINLYDQYTITDSIYSRSFINIRIGCATVFWSLIFYLWVLNKNKLNLTIFNKPFILGSGIIVKGGFEGLGEPELDTQHVTHKPMHMLNRDKLKDLDEDLISLALLEAQNESLSKNCSTTPPRHNPEVNGVPISYPTGYKTSTEKRPFYGSPFWAPSPKTASPTESNLESAFTSEGKGKNKVRFNENEDVTEIPNSASANANKTLNE